MQNNFYVDDEPRSVFVFGNPLRFLFRKGRTIGAYLSGALVNGKENATCLCIEIHKSTLISLLSVGGYLLMLLLTLQNMMEPAQWDLKIGFQDS